MNRSILIVICDFLLLSLLTFSTDINRMADQNTQPPTKVVVATNSVINAGTDLAAILKAALQEERKQHEQLRQQLAQARGAMNEQQSQAMAREQENARLQQQFAAAQTNLENLSRQVQTNALQANESQPAVEAARTETRRQGQLAEVLKRQIEQLAKTNQIASGAMMQLSNQLQLAEVEGRAAAERATLMQQEVQATRTENARLTEGFKSLETNSSQLTQEIRENRQLAPNTIFSQFVSNRVEASIAADRSGLFGMGLNKNKSTETILAGDGQNVFALCHV